MTKQQHMSNLVAAEMAKGKNAVSALKAVFGDEMIDRMIDALYSELRAKA